MTIVNILEIICSILSIIGTLLIAIPRLSGLIILAINGVIWVIYFGLTNQWYALISVVFVLIFELVGIYRWIDKGVGYNK